MVLSGQLVSQSECITTNRVLWTVLEWLLGNYSILPNTGGQLKTCTSVSMRCQTRYRRTHEQGSNLCFVWLWMNLCETINYPTYSFSFNMSMTGTFTSTFRTGLFSHRAAVLPSMLCLLSPEGRHAETYLRQPSWLQGKTWGKTWVICRALKGGVP